MKLKTLLILFIVILGTSCATRIVCPTYSHVDEKSLPSTEAELVVGSETHSEEVE